MRTTLYIPTTIIAAFVLAMPLLSYAQLQQDGILGCNQTGAYALGPASLNAVGGTFVPVSDKAVTLNTGYLAYKECVLRPAVSAEVHAATAAYDNAVITRVLTGNNGNPYFVQNFQREDFQAGDKARTDSFFTVTNQINSDYRNLVQIALERNYAQRTQAPQMSLACPKQTGVFAQIFSLTNPACDPIFAYYGAENQLDAYSAAARDAWRTQAMMGQGFNPILDANGNVLTPGILTEAVAEQAITSGYRQLENANDIGQMVGPLLAGAANRILSAATGGLASIGTSQGGQPSYLSQMTTEASQGLVQAVTNVALTILSPALSIEQSYGKAQNGMASDLLQAVTQLRGTENTCWNLIISNVCSGSVATSTAGATCTSADGSTLHIATSTAFSQPIVDAQIKPISDVVVANVQTSNQSVTAINTLIGDVQNTNSADIQRSALNQLDSLVAQGSLHTQPDLDKATQQASDLHTALFDTTSGLLPKTYHTWAGDDTVNSVNGATAWDGASAVGWCNVPATAGGTPTTAQKTTLDLWAARWK